MNAPNGPRPPSGEPENGVRGADSESGVEPLTVPSGEPRRRPLVTFAVLGGAMVAVFAGAAWYAYTPGGPGGGSGSAPLIQANSDPVRSKPENPGGIQVLHQDKRIFDKLIGQTEGEKRRVERLLPRPEKPLTTPTSEAEKAAQKAAAQAAQQAARQAAQQAAQQATQQAATTPPATPPKVVKPQAAKPQAAKPKVVKPKAEKPKQVAKAAAKPAPKPAAKAAKPAAKTAASASAAKPARPTPGGGTRVQIAALRSAAEAKAAWGKAQRKYAAELGALTLSIEEVQVKGRGLFYRVQGGPLSPAQARTICASLKARGQACIIVQR